MAKKDIKKKIEITKIAIQNSGGGNGDRGTDTNQGSIDTKGDQDRGRSTNNRVKDYHYSHKPGNKKNNT